MSCNAINLDLDVLVDTFQFFFLSLNPLFRYFVLLLQLDNVLFFLGTLFKMVFGFENLVNLVLFCQKGFRHANMFLQCRCKTIIETERTVRVGTVSKIVHRESLSRYTVIQGFLILKLINYGPGFLTKFNELTHQMFEFFGDFLTNPNRRIVDELHGFIFCLLLYTFELPFVGFSYLVQFLFGLNLETGFTML